MIFLTKRFYLALAAVALAFVLSLAGSALFFAAQLLLAALMLLLAAQIFALYLNRNGGVDCRRECPERLSNGCDNPVALHLHNRYPFAVDVELVDELPYAFQRRDMRIALSLAPNERRSATYSLHPVRRGRYEFGCINVFVGTRLRLVQRRFRHREPMAVKVYPAMTMLRKLAIAAVSPNLRMQGSKQVRRRGQQLEPDQIKAYVRGDDYRTINWKATARRHALMVNVFCDERDQNLICLIDKGRTMQAPFDGMSLLDYAVNATAALAYVAMAKGDKAGLMCFEKNLDCFLAPARTPLQFCRIEELLYAQTTTFAEADYSAAWCRLCEHVPNHALLVLFSAFDSLAAMNRQLEYLAMIARRHTLVAVFFEDSDLEAFAATRPASKKDIYETAIAQKMLADKHLIAATLRRHNIIPLLVRPENLTVSLVNKYLELKR